MKRVMVIVLVLLFLSVQAYLNEVTSKTLDVDAIPLEEILYEPIVQATTSHYGEEVVVNLPKSSINDYRVTSLSEMLVDREKILVSFNISPIDEHSGETLGRDVITFAIDPAKMDDHLLHGREKMYRLISYNHEAL
ncbi:DUF3888 domain-containing protein [Amphibacillus jilinensis]|uniref:DUF3888 domain-containing protein n=1 Tax=Amphibacillus jilinensis TaxID=1216008 RepID=UPI000318FC04|nr:DUF3888 domain-containing protein [Amphibacillus jilinensis]